MDIGIGNQDFAPKGVPKKNIPGKPGKGKPHAPHDRIIPGRGHPIAIITLTSSQPELFKINYTPLNFTQFLNEKVQKHQLPNETELFEKLSPETRKFFEKLLAKLQNKGFGPDPRKYVKLLSQKLPLALTFVESITKTLEKVPIPEIQERVVIQIKQLIQNVGKQFGSVEIKQVEQLLNEAPEKLITVVKQLVETKQLPNEQAKVLEKLIKMVITVKSFPKHNQTQVFQTLTTSETMNTPVFVGPQVKMFTEDIAQFIVKLLPEVKVPIPPKQAGEYLSKSFEQVILGGVILGKMLVDRGDGKPVSIEDAEGGKLIQLEIAKDLKIIDQFPFSLFALYAPFEQCEKDQSEAVKQAKNAMMKLVRLLIRLVIILVAIQTGGQKIGKGGTELMLREYQDYILGIMDELTFAFKKISELFGVKVKRSLSHLEKAKQALAKTEDEPFWGNIFTLFSENSDLKTFLEEVRDAEPLYDAINTLLTSDTIDPSTLRM